MAYNALRVDREELQQRLDELDKSIRPGQSRLDGMPRAVTGLHSAPVEATTIRREEVGGKLTLKLDEVKERLEPIEWALAALSDTDREILRRSFHSLDYSMSEAAAAFGLPLDQFRYQMGKAMR